MNKHTWLTRLTAVFLSVLILVILYPVQVSAEGLGLSGNFYRQHFELAPGEQSADDNIYVVVTNPNNSELHVKMVTDAPPDVTINLTQSDFLIPADGQQKVGISVEAGAAAVPGDYILTISAEAYREGSGIQVNAGTLQQAKLSILGEAGQVTVTTVSEAGESLPLNIVIYELSGEQPVKVRSGQGYLKSKLKPADYLVKALYQESELAQQSFTLQDGDIREIVLTCPVLCVTDLAVSPNNSSSNQLVSVKIAYTLVNYYQPLTDIKVMLSVRMDGRDLEELELNSYDQLETGSKKAAYNYNPAQGWQSGQTYSFSLSVNSGSKTVYQSESVEFVPTDSGLAVQSENGQSSPEAAAAQVAGAVSESGSVNWILILSIVVAVLIILVVVLLATKKRRAK